ncbi:sulfatase-like hydrolase/transferase [Puniceicoccales bacterium CK1056]|uniref:Sulfatase-like hydrolase/transferase n=1 Tax=Oceanipulchritudo coccoides TaxID=2706888 RepID=A0A6B2LWU3_9BACT|nr:sulfatase-like hydrolase/transferase [Oceanipulchritudo coccoides]NDV60901.1 sulfatase-like hydrolase/transferase [Oceanipulchritudo coccoides]
MRNLYYLTALFLLNTTVHAQWSTVWSEDFSAAVLNDPVANPVPITSAEYDFWQSGGPASINSGQLRVDTQSSGNNRGVAIALTGMDSGNYRLSFDIVSMYANCTFQVSLFDGTSDGGAANTYKLDLLSGNSAPLVHEGSISPLTSQTYVQADAGPGKEITFTFDGTGEIVLVMDMPASAGFTQRAIVDNLILETDGIAVPIAPVFAMDTIYRASAFVGEDYANSIAFTAYHENGEALTYTKLSNPSWLIVDADGSLSGTPTAGDIGENTFSVQVTSAGGTDTATLSLYVVEAPQPTVRPNILYILADDLGYMDVSAHNHPDLEFETPNIDSIFDSGVLFTAGFVSNSVCAPSRAGLMTGRYGSRFGYESNFSTTIAGGAGSTIGLDANQDTIASVLKAVGYRTFCVGKWHLGENETLFHPNVRGFDEFFGIIGGSRNYVKTTGLSDEKVLKNNYTVVAEPSDMYLTDFFTDQALTYITDEATSNPDQPWFLYMSYTAPHGPMDAREEDVLRVPLAGLFGGNYSRSIPTNILRMDGIVQTGSTANNDELRRIYGAMVLSMDDNIGRLMHRLGELGIADKTLVVFHSDNGGPGKGSNWSLNRTLRGTKGSLWEGGIRVPFAIQWPGTIPSGQVIGYDVPVSAIDMLPTFAAISSADQIMDIRTDGANLMPLLRGRVSTLGDRQLFWRRGTTLQIAIRSGDWKYYKNRNTGDEYLFDHSAGSGEYSGNQAVSNPSKLAELQAEYADLEAAMPYPHWNADGELLAITSYDLEDAVAGTPYTMPLTCSLPSGASPPVWSIIDGKPGWLSIHPTTGELTGTPAAGDSKFNLITLQIESDGNTSAYQVPLLVQGGFDPENVDRDMLPDSWEVAKFGNLTTTAGAPNENQDGDANSDYDEYLFGTNPTDPSSFLKPLLQVAPGSLTVSVDGIAGRRYLLQGSSTMANGEWFYSDSIEWLESDGPISLQADYPDGTKRFFARVVTAE